MTAINTSMIAMTRYRVCEASFVAHPAPNQAPNRLPASRLTMTDQCASHRRERHRCGPKRQRGSDNDQTHRLVEDHRLESGKPKCADQQRQAEFRAAQTYQAAERADDSAAQEGSRCSLLRRWVCGKQASSRHCVLGPYENTSRSPLQPSPRCRMAASPNALFLNPRATVLCRAAMTRRGQKCDGGRLVSRGI